jgi:N-acetylneuraminic acid mutarotase
LVGAGRRSWIVTGAVVLGLGACGGGDGTNGATRAATSSSPAVTSVKAAQLQVAAAPWKLTAAIANEVLVAEGRQFVILGGLDATKLSTAAVVRVDPATGSSRPAGSLREAVHDSAGAPVAGGNLVIGGGGPSENGTADAQLVSPSGSATIVGKMPQPRSDHVAASVGGRIYVLGGYDGANIVADVVSTVDGSSFTTVARLPVPVRYPAITVIGKSIYLFGGVASTQGTDTAAIQRLDTATGVITIVGQLPSTVSHASAVQLGDEVFLLGGYVNNTQLSDQILRFDPATNTVTNAGRLPEPNSDAAAIVIGNQGYLVGGKSTARDPLTSVIILALH